jgi:hypothetical protein
MNFKNIIKNIKETDCVGDSLSKHNYNFLSLDTEICNISSVYYNIDENYYSFFTDLCANINNFNDFASFFENPINIENASTATKYLSSFWEKTEITITFPINIYELDGFIKNNITSNFLQINDVLKRYAFNYLNLNYPFSKVNKNTIANIIFLIHSNNGSLIEEIQEIPNAIPGNKDRFFEGNFNKNDLYISEIKISKFYINEISKIWTPY